MARFRLARPAQNDLASILATSSERWWTEGQRRYAAILVAAMCQIAADPEGPLTQSRAELRPGLRSFHIRHTRSDDPVVKVKRPVHVLYYRTVQRGVIDVVRVLHERMEPSRHLRRDEDEP